MKNWPILRMNSTDRLREMWTRRRGVSKIPKILRRSYVHGPLSKQKLSPSWSNLTMNLQSFPPATPAVAATSTPPRSRQTSPRRAAVSTLPPPRRGRPQTPRPSSSSSTWDSQVSQIALSELCHKPRNKLGLNMQQEVF